MLPGYGPRRDRSCPCDRNGTVRRCPRFESTPQALKLVYVGRLKSNQALLAHIPIYIYIPPPRSTPVFNQQFAGWKIVKTNREVLQKSTQMFLISVRSIFFFASHAPWECEFQFLAPLCGINAKKKWAFYIRGVVKIEIVLPMLRMKHIFFVLLMQREKHNFEIDLTPTVKMTFLKGGWKLL